MSQITQSLPSPMQEVLDKVKGETQFLLDGEMPTGLTDLDSLQEHLRRMESAVQDAIVTATMAMASDAPMAGGVVLPPGNAAAAPIAAPKRSRRNAPERSNTMTTTTPQAAPNTNKITFEDMLVTATELGKQAGQGKDVQIKFDLKVLEAAFHGSLDLDANKHGADSDDATKLSEAYARAQNSAVIFDAKAGNQRKLISTTRKCIKLGMWPKGGPGEPLSTVNTLISLRQKLRQDPANAKKLDDAHNTLMRYATMQLKRDHTIDEHELRTFCFKAQPEPRDGAEVIEAIRKTLNNLKVGKINNCPDLDNSQEVQDMIRLCTKRLTAIAKAKGVQPADAKSAAKAAPAATTTANTVAVNQASP